MADRPHDSAASESEPGADPAASAAEGPGSGTAQSSPAHTGYLDPPPSPGPPPYLGPPVVAQPPYGTYSGQPVQEGHSGTAGYPGAQQSPDAYPGAPQSPVAYPGGAHPGGYPGPTPPPPPPYGGFPGQPPGGPPSYGGYPGQQPGSPAPYGAYPGSGWDGGQPPAGSGGWSKLAIAAFVCSFVPLLGSLVAVPLAIVALVRMGKLRQRGKGLAIAALIISVLWWALIITVGVLVGGNAERNAQGEIDKKGLISFTDIRPGDCVQIDGMSSGADVRSNDLKGVPCNEPHNAQSAGDASLTESDYPGLDAMTDGARPDCLTAITGFIDPAELGSVQPFLFAPSEDLWKSDSDSHKVICFVVRSDLSDMTGSLQR